MEDATGHPLEGALDHWNSLLEDTAATAADYRARGWESTTLEPGDVTVDLELPGFDVLVPDNEFDRLVERFGDGVDEYQVYLASAAGLVFALVALERPDDEQVALVPFYYRHAQLDALRATAEETGALSTRLRTLDRTDLVVRHEEPELFFPGG